jgi:hypothetical protein
MKHASKILVDSVLSIAFLFPPALLAAAKEARVTTIIRDVKLVSSDAAARAAALNDKVAEDTGVRTGGESRSELTFPDLTITRLGANTIFTFSKGGRTANVDTGSILLRVPKDSGGGTVRNNAVTVAITGTTVIFEGNRSGKSKLITLEGGSKVSLKKNPKEFRKVLAGQMIDIPAGATTLPMPVNVDLNDIMRNHPLITDFKPLPSQPLIMAAAQQPPPAPAPPPPPPITFTGPSIVPVINFGGGFNRPPHRGPQPSRSPGNNPPPTTNQSPGQTKTPPPRSQSTPTPPPVLLKTLPPGQTQAAGTTNTNNKKAVKKPTPPPGPR